MEHDPSPSNGIARRELMTSAAALAGVGLASSATVGCASVQTFEAPTAGLVRANQTVLFQGDSVTDSGRSRETAQEPNAHSTLGSGYAWLAGIGLLVGPQREGLRVFNRGVSGEKVPQLAERWDEDCLALEPDVVSILIGINDIWHARNGSYDGTAETYERDYDDLLARTLEARPQVKLVICEPFVLRCGSVDDSWFPEFDGFRAAARRVAKRVDATWVPFQSAFDDAVAYSTPETWAADGVHPTQAGAALMAQTWLHATGMG